MTHPPPILGVCADGAGEPLGSVFARIARDPGTHLLRRWNWKSALLSSGSRGLVFFCVNLPAGHHAAIAALNTELALRLATSGFYGALTEAFRDVEPAWHGMGAAMVLLPVLAHSLELCVHWLRGTAELTTSILASVAFTLLSTAFNVFAMRRGVLVVGRGSQPLHRDLLRMPSLISEFVSAGATALWRSFAGPRVRPN